MKYLADRIAADLQAELDRSWTADPSLPGIVATVNAPRIGFAWSGASGGVARDGLELLTPAHAFRIASATKPYTSAVALRLVETGRLDLFAPIAPLLASATRAALEAAGYAPDRMTPYQLLTHASGLRDHAGPDSPYGELVMQAPGHVWSHAEQLELCLSLGGPLSQPGARFSYSDTGYLILGNILEQITDEPLFSLMRRLLRFDRLGLEQTHFERHEPAPPSQARAGQYHGAVASSEIDCSCDLSGGGGLVATTAELATFYRAAALGELFDRPQTLALALATPSLQFNPPLQALHSALMRGRWVGGEPCWMHGGFWGVVVAYAPASDVTLAVGFNQAVAGRSTVGDLEQPAQASLADRLALLAQTACKGVA
jgi:D-alanyl-D-alanine carboxypeptidase